MAKYDVHRTGDNGSLVVDCQSDLLGDLGTRFVVLLLPSDGVVRASARLNPVVQFEGQDYIVLPQGAATIEKSELGPSLGSLAEHDLTIGNALDMLISGF